MEYTSQDRSSLDIQPSSTEPERQQSDKHLNPFPEITRIAIEIWQKARAESKRTASSVAESEDLTLDPNTSEFRPGKWVEKVLSAADDPSWKSRQTSLLLKNVDILGGSYAEEEQETVLSVLLWPFRNRKIWQKRNPRRILRNINCFTRPGDMLLVLGRPGSGCSSLLTTIAGNLDSLSLGENSVIHYNGKPQCLIIHTDFQIKIITNPGISHRVMSRNFRGEAVYNDESDTHFPHLTVDQTLKFAAALRMPRNRLVGKSKQEHIQTVTAVAMAMCGLTHVRDVKVGNDYVRGVSGGERKVIYYNNPRQFL